MSAEFFMNVVILLQVLTTLYDLGKSNIMPVVLFVGGLFTQIE